MPDRSGKDASLPAAARLRQQLQQPVAPLTEH